MKRIIAFIFVCIFLISFASSLTFDNRITYEKETETITIKDHWNLPLIGEDLVKVKLEENTYLCGVECYAIWNVTIYADDDNFLSDLIFEQIKGIGGVSDYKFEYISGYKEVTYNDYGKDCDIRDEWNYCAKVLIGTHKEKVPIWSEFNPNRKLPIGDYIIKLTGTKLWGDTIDWIPTFYGKEFREWAFWASTPPTSYWKFNEAENEEEAIDELGLNNLTLRSPSDFVLGKLNNAWNASTSALAPRLNHTGASQFAFGTDDFTIAFWINMSSGGSVPIMKTNEELPTGWGFNRVASALRFSNDNAGVIDVSSAIDDTWHRVVFIREGTGANLFRGYLDGVNTVNGTLASDITNTTANFTIFSPNSGTLQIDDLQIYNGFAWSVADVVFDYNLGDGREGDDTSGNLNTTLNSPANNTILSTSSINFNASSIPSNLNFTNATLRVYNSSTILFNSSNISISGNVINESIFTMNNFVRGTYFWNVEFCGIADNESASTICDSGFSNRTFIVRSSEIQTGFNDFTYETAEETFQINITLLSGDTISSVNLFYNGTSNSATSTLISGNNFSLQSTIDIPTSAIGSNTTQWFFSMNLNTGQENTTFKNQSVGAINLSIFGQGIGGLPYINFTFQNETTAQEAISATFSSSWTYFLGSGAITKTLLFTNATENFNYSFQFHPQNRTLFTDMTATYGNSESQQRSFNPSLFTLTNSTLSQVLLLLPTSDGIFQQFVTQTTLGSTVADVNFVINRSISGVSTLIASGATDGSGFASIFLNPDFIYNAIFSKTGLANNVFSFQPSNQLRTVVMGGAAEGVSNGTTINLNTTYLIKPINSSLANGTDYVFSFEITSSQPINSISMNITNASGFQVGFQSDTSATIISQTINTGENNTFVGTFNFATANESITVTKVWNIGQQFVGDYSIFRQLTLYTTYGFKDFIRFILAIMFIGGVLIFMTSGETFDTSESKIAVSLLLIWAFSIVGWFTIPGPAVVNANATLATLSQFSNQYGIAILSSGAGVFFIFRRIFT